MRGRSSANEHPPLPVTPFPIADDSTDGEAEAMQDASASKGTKRPASDEASDPPPPSKRRISAASFFAPVSAPDPPQNLFRSVRCKKDARKSFAFPMSPLRSRARSHAMATSASGSGSGSGSVDIFAPWKDKRQQPPPATSGSAQGSVESTEIVRLEAMAARHRAIAASIEKTIAELKRPFAAI